MSDPLILSGSFSGKVSEFTREARFSASFHGKWFLLTKDNGGWLKVQAAPFSFKGRAAVSFYNDTYPLVEGVPVPFRRVDVTCSDGVLVYYPDCHWEESSSDCTSTGDDTELGGVDTGDDDITGGGGGSRRNRRRNRRSDR